MSLLLALLLATLPTEPPPVSVIRDAIKSVAPRYLSKTTAGRYAKIIDRVARRRNIHPFLFVAFIHVETARRWDPRTHSKTNDYGLMQVHVAERGSARFLGREEELFNPATNIREWGRLADMWRSYHNRTCDQESHPWWAHLKWGFRVKDSEHADKVKSLYVRLLRKFRQADLVATSQTRHFSVACSPVFSADDPSEK